MRLHKESKRIEEEGEEEEEEENRGKGVEEEVEGFVKKMRKAREKTEKWRNKKWGNERGEMCHGRGEKVGRRGEEERGGGEEERRRVRGEKEMGSRQPATDLQPEKEGRERGDDGFVIRDEDVRVCTEITIRGIGRDEEMRENERRRRRTKGKEEKEEQSWKTREEEEEEDGEERKRRRGNDAEEEEGGGGWSSKDKVEEEEEEEEISGDDLSRSTRGVPHWKLRTTSKGEVVLLFLPWLAWALVLGRCSLTEAKYIEGTLRTTENWAFLTRFCFLSLEGTYTFDIEYDVDFAVEKILLYYDSPDQWPAVYKTGKTCLEKEAVMKKDNNQFINLTRISGNAECEVLRAPGQKAKYHCQGRRSFRSVRERWWFIAISNCESDKGLQLKYRFTMTNGKLFWYKHFSADEFYILRTNLTALGLHMGLLFLSLLAAAELKNRQLFHTTYRLFMCAMVLHISSIVFCSLHYARYGYDGMGFPNSLLAGRVFSACSTVVMVLLLLLMGKGFNITRGRLRETSAVRLTVFMSIFTVTYASLFIYERNLFDPGDVLYIYESPAGYCLVGLRMVGWAMLLYACFFTLKHYPEKGNFYYPFFVFYTLWFLSGPVVILISNHVIDKWVREKVVNGVELSITFLGHAFFLFLTRPNAANKNFPYHVRTSQINVMKTTTTGIVGNNSMDAFAAHPYAPDMASEPRNFTAPDLFLVSGAVEMKPMPQLQNITTTTSSSRPQGSYPHPPPGVPPSLFTTTAAPAQAPPLVNPRSIAKQMHYHQQQQQHQEYGQELEKSQKPRGQTSEPPPSYPYHELQLSPKNKTEVQEEVVGKEDTTVGEEEAMGKEESEEGEEEGSPKKKRSGSLPALKTKPRELPPLQLRPLDEMYDFSSKKFNPSS
ncbi:uncharacterized protein LOC143035254 [Oratosquilla oratoria]|uniref:uncharacterized protein LOC143035254 n=1 Tax=Oratosquilla oratoria TaxID=337810 RepID=UPI003F765F25